MTAASIIRLAKPGEEAMVFDFFVKSHADNGFFPISSKKVIDTIMRAIRGENASIGIIVGPQGIEAATGLCLEQTWYSESWFLAELLNYVDVDHRRSRHAQALLKFQKDFSDKITKALGYSVPIIPGILTRSRLQAKMRLFQREFQQVGALFIYGAADYMKPDDEFQNQKKVEAPRKMNGHDVRHANGHPSLAGTG